MANGKQQIARRVLTSKYFNLQFIQLKTEIEKKKMRQRPERKFEEAKNHTYNK